MSNSRSKQEGEEVASYGVSEAMKTIPLVSGQENKANHWL